MSTENDLLFTHSGALEDGGGEAVHVAAAAAEDEGVVESEEFEKFLNDRREFLDSSGLIDGLAEGDLMRVLDCGDLFKPFVAAESVGKEESSGSNGSPSRGGKFAATESILEEQNSHSAALHAPDLALEGSSSRPSGEIGDSTDSKKLDHPTKTAASSCMPMHQMAIMGSCRGKWLLEDLAGVIVMPEQQHQSVTFSDGLLFSEATTTTMTTTGESSSTSLPTSVAQAAAGEFGSGSSKDAMLEGIFPMGGILQIPEDAEPPRFVRGMDLAGDSLHPFHTPPPPPPPTMHGFCHPSSSMQRSLSIGHVPMSALPSFQSTFSSIPSLDHHHHHHAIPGSHLSPQALMESLHGSMGPSSMIRRVFSTGDIQPTSTTAATTTTAASPSQDDPASKVGRYTAEERKVRIDRYRQKRTERNFIKKIKYACRKTLADSRPRIRGRFAKNQDAGLPQTKRKLEDDDDEDCDLLLDEEEDYFVDRDAGSNKIMEGIRTEDRDLFEVAFNNLM